MVVAAVAVSLPMATGIMHGSISPESALIRFLLALVLCWVAGSVLTGVMDRYTVASRQAEILRVIQAAKEARAQAQEAAARNATQSGAPGTPGAGAQGGEVSQAPGAA